MFRKILKRDYIKWRQKTSLKEEILSVRSRNQDSFLFVIHTTAKIFEDSMTQTWPSDFWIGQFLSQFPSSIFSKFQDSSIFGKATSSHFFRATNWHNSYFFKVKTISSEQLLFLRTSFRKSHFLVAAIFSEYLIFLSKPTTEQPLFKNKKFFRPVSFWNS